MPGRAIAARCITSNGVGARHSDPDASVSRLHSISMKPFSMHMATACALFVAWTFRMMFCT